MIRITTALMWSSATLVACKPPDDSQAYPLEHWLTSDQGCARQTAQATLLGRAGDDFQSNNDGRWEVAE
jgi:hypothetical protein